MTGLALACADAGAGAAGAADRAAAAGGDAGAAVRRPRDRDRRRARAACSRRSACGRSSRGDAQPICDIRVGERHSPLTVHYDHREVGDQPLGHIVENRLLRGALLRRAEQLAGHGLALAAPAQIVRLDCRERLARLAARERGGALSGRPGRRRRGPLVADPRRRRASRSCAGTTGRPGSSPRSRTSGRTSGLAVERFFPDGPFAILPMTGRRSSIVWAAHDRLARELIGLADDDFMAELGERFGEQLGALALAGPRWHYPLSMIQARRYTGRRLALVGDAAHAIHPIAGQGWNLALRDVAALAELLVDAKRLGLDPGSAAVLARYERWRRFDSLALIAITDGLNRLFGNDLLPLRLARELGLGLVERVGPLKQFFMRHAMGLLGDLPRLMRGEAL